MPDGMYEYHLGGSVLPKDAPSIPGREAEFAIARAIYNAIRREAKRRNRGYVLGEPGPHRETIIDGEFHLMSVARAVLRALRTGKIVLPDS